MHSRAEVPRLRRALEHGARVIALLLLLLVLYQVTRPADAPPARRVADDDAGRALRAATFGGGERPLAMRFTRAPEPVVRDWAAALRRSGVPVSWRAEGITAAALSIEAIADPRGGHEVRVWRDNRAPALVRDAAGELARLEDAGVSIVSSPGVIGTVQLHLPDQQARVDVRDSLETRAVLVLARAGWEARFLLRALEEIGWPAHARLSVAPGLSVVQGSPSVLDTARYAAVIVLDTTAATQAAAITRFVRSGGGLILAGEGATVAGLAPLSPATATRRLASSREDLPGEAPRDGLTHWSAERLRSDATALEVQRSSPVITARRVGAGRVLQVGYEDSWRLRMETGEHGPEMHREWWARLIATVAYAPSLQREVQPSSLGEQAPLVAMLNALGDPREDGVATPVSASLPLLPLFITALVLLSGEWFSRRLRGAA